MGAGRMVAQRTEKEYGQRWICMGTLGCLHSAGVSVVSFITCNFFPKIVHTLQKAVLKFELVI